MADKIITTFFMILSNHDSVFARAAAAVPAVWRFPHRGLAAPQAEGTGIPIVQFLVRMTESWPDRIIPHFSPCLTVILSAAAGLRG